MDRDAPVRGIGRGAQRRRVDRVHDVDQRPAVAHAGGEPLGATGEDVAVLALPRVGLGGDCHRGATVAPDLLAHPGHRLLAGADEAIKAGQLVGVTLELVECHVEFKRRLDQPVVIRIVAGHEVQRDRAVGAVVAPRLVAVVVRQRIDPVGGATLGPLDPQARLALAQVDDAPVVELRVATLEGLDAPAIASPERRQPELASRDVPPPEMLGEAAAVGAQVDRVATGPELVEPRDARGAVPQVERAQLGLGRDRLEVAPHELDRGRRVLARGRAVGPDGRLAHGRTGLAVDRRDERNRPRQLDLRLRRVEGHEHRPLEGEACGVGMAGEPLESAAREEQRPVEPDRRGGRGAECLERGQERRVDPLVEGDAPELQQAGGEARVHRDGVRERVAGEPVPIDAEHGEESATEAGGAVAAARLRETEAVPWPRPVGPQVGRPLELAEGVVEVGLGRLQLGEPQREDAEAQVVHRLEPFAAGDLDQGALLREQAGRVGRVADRVAQPVERLALVHRLGPGSGGEREQRQCQRRGPPARHGRATVNCRQRWARPPAGVVTVTAIW